jgi:hypothetical protein
MMHDINVDLALRVGKVTLKSNRQSIGDKGGISHNENIVLINPSQQDLYKYQGLHQKLSLKYN